MRNYCKLFLFFFALSIANISLADFRSSNIDKAPFTGYSIPPPGGYYGKPPVSKGLIQFLSNRIYVPKDQSPVISDRDQRLQVNFVYDKNADPSLTIKDTRVYQGVAPRSFDTDGDYKLATVNSAGDEVGSLFFNVPNVIYGPPNLEGERPAEVDSVVLDRVSFSETMKYGSEVAGVKLTDGSGKIINFQNLEDVQMPCETGQSLYIKRPVSDSVTRNGPLSLLIKKVLAAQDTLYIAIIGDKYTDLNEFSNDANDVIASFLTLKPYEDRASQIKFNLVNNTSDLGCRYDAVVARLLYCDNSLVTSAVNASGVSYDKIIVIVDSAEYGGSGGAVAVGYNGSEMLELLGHEFGHTFGGLLDAYILYSGNGVIDNKTHSLFGDRGNCYAGSPPTSDWPGIPLSSYFNGCNYSNWKRASASSLMLTLSSFFFNEVEQRKVGDEITKYAGSPSPGDATPPNSVITSPSNGATVGGTITVTADAIDNVGVARAELWIDSSLFATDYTFPFNFTWPTIQNTNGSHNLVVKAHDSASNIGTSAVVKVTVSNSIPDSSAPTVSISSPANKSIVSGLMLVNVSATDNSGSVEKVELYVDGGLVDTAVDEPASGRDSFILTWDTVKEMNGSHSLRAKAYDLSGNIGSSATIRVTTRNAPSLVDEIPPTVYIKSSLKKTGKIKFIARAADNGGKVSKMELIIDNVIRKTCIKKKSCGIRILASSLSLGVHTFNVRAYDPAGNMGEQTIIFYK